MSTWISVSSFIVSGIALGWNIYRDCIDRPKIRIKAYIADSAPVKYATQADIIKKMYEVSPSVNINPAAIDSISDNVNEIMSVIYVEIINTGKKTTIINQHEFKLEDGCMVVKNMMEKFHNKKLEPYERLQVVFPNQTLIELSEIAEKIKAFYVYDTCGTKWKLKNKCLCKLKEDLIRQRKNLKE